MLQSQRFYITPIASECMCRTISVVLYHPYCIRMHVQNNLNLVWPLLHQNVCAEQSQSCITPIASEWLCRTISAILYHHYCIRMHVQNNLNHISPNCIRMHVHNNLNPISPLLHQNACVEQSQSCINCVDVSVWMNACNPCECACCASSQRFDFEPWFVCFIA